jgi:aspartate 1-decarboxylase
MRTMLKSKIHRARVTSVNTDYEGSVTIDGLLMEAADILPYEMVYILDIENGVRLQTYAIEGERGSGALIINGAAARVIHKGDKVIILSYINLSQDEAPFVEPKLVYVDSKNSICSQKGGKKTEQIISV